MGILYNRFTPEPSFLPYSNPFKIVTYATPDNFDASSSTWGTGTAPLVRNWGSWAKNADGSVTFSSLDAIYPVVVNNIDSFTAPYQGFTIYEVLRFSSYSEEYAAEDHYNTVIYRGDQTLGETNEQLFAPSYDFGDIGYNSRIGNLIYRNSFVDFSVLRNFHITVAAYAHYHTGEGEATEYHFDSELRYNDTRTGGNRVRESIAHHDIQNIQFAGSRWGVRTYKFIAIVTEKEPSNVISNNIAHLKEYFNVEY